MKEDKVWQDYLSKHFEKFINGLTKNDFIDGKKLNYSDIEIDKSIPKNTYISLRKYINQDAIKSLQNRFRAHKHRQKTGIKNIQLKENYLIMLEKFKNLVGAETLEETIDFLLSPDYRDYEHDVNQAKAQLAEDSFSSTEVMTENFAKRLKNYDRERLSLIIEMAFNEGWQSAKQSKKRTGNPRKEALSQTDLYNDVVKLITKGNDGDY
ncbi:hypothetical protein [Alteromonas stellipolaris]|uniref:hypothetical protein n=1 Tax=Alteromonas stellipolaris TaxID=233316 RepID=UPI001D956635|nr:hypothetical protein [Alteromonas stellipolaris]MBZ2164273.1 hypothetical protein [Alteromonas stellipolaris]